MKKVIAGSLFLLFAFLGSIAVGGGFERVGMIATFLIVMVTFSMMWYAVGMWKDSNKSKAGIDDTGNPDPTNTMDKLVL